MKEKFLNRFYNDVMIPYGEELLFSLDVYFKQEQEKLQYLFLNSMQDICKRIIKLQEQKQEQKQVAYIGYTMLRTNLLERKFTYVIFAYDKDWYLGETLATSYFDVSDYFKDLPALWDKLLDIRKQYMGISENNIENFVSHLFHPINQYIIKTIDASMSAAIQLEEYNQIQKINQKAKKITIYVSELFEEPLYCF